MAEYTALYEAAQAVVELLRQEMTPEPISKPELIGLCAPQEPEDFQLTVHLYHLEEEAHKYTGFVRFSDQGGVLVSEIQPKNRVLPLLRVHFTQRLNTEAFVIFDRTHREGLVHQGGRWAILPMEDFDSGPVEDRELYYRRLWRRFFQTIGIEGRTNPRCQNTHLPKRYRAMMTEFQPDEGQAALPFP